MDASNNKEMDSSDPTLSKELSEDFGDEMKQNFSLQFSLSIPPSERFRTKY